MFIYLERVVFSSPGAVLADREARDTSSSASTWGHAEHRLRCPKRRWQAQGPAWQRNGRRATIIS